MFQLTGSSVRVIGLVCAALLPAALVWWTGRVLLRNVDDPVLPERLMATRLRGRVLVGFSWGLVVVLAPEHALWAIPLMIVARALAAYPLRKALQVETWSPLAYLSFFTRLVLAFYGFWLLLIWAPSLEGLFGDADWIVAPVVASILVAWNDWYGAVAWRLLRAFPVTDPNLTALLSHMAARAEVPQPPIGVVPLGGGVLANAVALPSRRHSRVLVSSTFIERFTHDEIVAICAHEIAHLEYYSGARMRREYLQTLAIALVGALLEPAARLFFPASQSWLFVAWLVIVVTLQAIRTRSRQKNETASDIRAVALSGNPEALASALVKLHAMALVPRRWDAKVERHATHPSLARRIQAIQEAAGRAAPVLEHHESFTSCGQIVTFERDRLQWSTDALSMQSIGYQRLTELRLDVNRSHAPCLVAADRSGQRWKFALDAADLPRVQRVLDIVDAQLGAAVGAPSVSFAALRLMSLLTALVAATASQFAVLLPVVLALARPSAALAASVGAGAIATAVVAWRDGAETGAGLWPALAIALCGAALLALAWVCRKDEDAQPLAKPFAVLGLSSLLAWIALLLSGVSVLRLHQSAHASPAAIVIPVALAAALTWSRPGLVRRTAPAVLLVAALVFAIGSRTYLESFSRDRFIAQGPSVAVNRIIGPALSETPISTDVFTVRLSPDAHSVALGSDDDDDGPRVFQVGSVAGPFESIDCDDAFFVDDRRLLVVNHLRSGVRLRIVRLRPGLPTIQDRLVEDIRGATVEFRQSTGAWVALGTGTNNEIVRLEGNVHEGPLVERRWSDDSEPRRGTWVQPVAATRDRVLMRRNQYHAGFFGSRYYALLNMLAPSWTESEFWIVGTDGNRPVGTSGLTVDCRAFAMNEDVSGCAVFDGARTTLFSLDLRSGDLDARATLQGRLRSSDHDGSGWITGQVDGQPIALRLEQARAWQIAAEPHAWVTAVGASPGGIATVAQAHRNSILRVYSLPPR
jgi:Zn-dependent protease with chaperone function